MDTTSATTASVAALVAAENLGRPVNVEGVPHAIIPGGYALANLERLLASPKRPRGNFGVETADAFTRTVNLLRQDSKAKLPIFYGRRDTQATVAAVLNFADWRDLTVTLAQRLSDPFMDWFRLNAQPQAQRVFALFLEERTAHVVRPEGAALLELARKFKANVQVRYQSFIEDQNADGSLEFIQSTEAGTAGAKSRMKVPNFVTLCLPVWNGGEPVKFDARFGYSITDGKLALSFEILRVNELLTDELRKIVEKIGRDHANSVLIDGANSAVPALG